MSQPTGEYKRWFLTINNYTEDETTKLRNYACDYMCMGFEVAPTTGTLHVHVYFEFKSGKKFSTMKRAFPRARLEVAKGTLDQCKTYCSKDGQFEERGTPKQQGQRNDLNHIAEMLESGASIGEVARAAPAEFIRYSRGIEALRIALRAAPRQGRSAITWLHGKAGTGKSYYAKARHPNGKLFIKEPGNKWWDGYDFQEAVLIDDFDPSDGYWSTNDGYRNLLRLLDEGPCKVEVKGNTMEFNSKFIYITCEHPPSYYWSGNKLDQVLSRIGEVRLMQGEWRQHRQADAARILDQANEQLAREEFINLLEQEQSREDTTQIDMEAIDDEEWLDRLLNEDNANQGDDQNRI